MSLNYNTYRLDLIEKYINKFNYSDYYISKIELRNLINKNEPLIEDEFIKVLITSSKRVDEFDNLNNIKISNIVVLDKKYLYLFYYILCEFWEEKIPEYKLRAFEIFLRRIFKSIDLKVVDLNPFERNFYFYLKTDSYQNKGIEKFLYEKFNDYFKNEKEDIYKFCEHYYIFLESFILKRLLYRYLKENKNRLNSEKIEIIKFFINI